MQEGRGGRKRNVKGDMTGGDARLTLSLMRTSEMIGKFCRPSSACTWAVGYGGLLAATVLVDAGKTASGLRQRTDMVMRCVARQKLLIHHLQPTLRAY